MSRVEAFLRFLWDFVVGDDWRIAVGVVVALGITALVAGTSIAAWWILPVAVFAVLAGSGWPPPARSLPGVIEAGTGGAAVRVRGLTKRYGGQQGTNTVPPKPGGPGATAVAGAIVEAGVGTASSQSFVGPLRSPRSTD